MVPRQLIKLGANDDVESEIVPIEFTENLTNAQAAGPHQVIVPRPRSDLGSEIEQLWNKAV